MNSGKIKKITLIAIIGAIYTVLTLVFSYFSFGIVQIRLAETLTILACFSMIGVWGVTFGCFFSNLVGMFIGITSFWDVIFGTIATLIAAILAYKLRNIKYKNLPVLSSFMPVFINGIIIGTMLFVLTISQKNIFLLNLYIVSVMLGELVTAVVFGLTLYKVFEKIKVNELFESFS